MSDIEIQEALDTSRFEIETGHVDKAIALLSNVTQFCNRADIYQLLARAYWAAAEPDNALVILDLCRLKNPMHVGAAQTLRGATVGWAA